MLVLLLGASCAPPALPKPSPRSVANVPPAPSPVAAEPADKPEVAPPAPALTASRLVSATCANDPKDVEVRVAQMRAEVKAQLKVWHDAQPGCWHEMWLDAERQREEERQLRIQFAHEAQLRAAGVPGDSIGEVFGAGGLGLTGIGEGGGGRGEGIGLGSISSFGHAGGVAAARSVSGTNNQVAGVDEADIVKTDGRYVYLAANGALRIVAAMDPKVLSVTRIPGTVRELFVEGDRAAVYSSSAAPAKRCTYGYDCRFAGDGTSTRITVLDLADRARPKVVRTIELSGSLMASRRIGHAVHTVVADGDAERPLYTTWPDDLQTCGTEEKFVRAKFAELVRDNTEKIRRSARSMPTLRDGGLQYPLCGGLLRTASGDGNAFTTIVSFDLSRDDEAPTSSMIQSRPGAVFASADALYLAVTRDRGDARSALSGHEVTELHQFRIGDAPAATRYLGSGVVPGHVLNQFAMDQWDGRLRIATTQGRVPDPAVASAITVLAPNADHDLVRVGSVDGLAPGEDIRSVRFEGDRGYVVTFKKTDPLFVIDLAEPERPKILGELKIPGFSTYMHRIDDTHLLSIGFDANDHGSFAYFDGLLLQLFDVSDPKEPRLLFREKIGTRGSSSEAATNHLAFTYLADRGMLAVPVTLCEGGGDGVNGRDLAFSGLLVYRVDVAGGFTKLGGIDHGKRGASCDSWWSTGGSAVKRSVFLDDLVYSIADDRVKVQRLGHFGDDVADIALAP